MSPDSSRLECVAEMAERTIADITGGLNSGPAGRPYSAQRPRHLANILARRHIYGALRVGEARPRNVCATARAGYPGLEILRCK